MANEETNKFTTNLKVPPLKIVLSSHQNNAVVNITTLENDPLESAERADTNNDDTDQKDFNRRGSQDVIDSCEKQGRRATKGCSERGESEMEQTSGRASSSSSSSQSSSDRSSSSTPSSESESLASNSTIISDHHHQNKSKTFGREDSANNNKQDKSSRICSKVPAIERSSNSAPFTSGKKTQEASGEQLTDSSNSSISKDPNLNANQRITRSSQRAAQQNKSENPSELNGDEPVITENPEKAHEFSRKVKRRKGEPQEIEQDGSQAVVQPSVMMANIYPADYQLPSQNSFELYRDIRKKPYKKLMKLNHIQPRTPHGFKDYLLNGGPYLLDGNKLGVGLSGASLDSFNNNQTVGPTNQLRASRKIKSDKCNQKLPILQSSNHRYTAYKIPKTVEAPKSLPVGSPLYELYLDQEKSRHQMRMQHLKERERSILAVEQEILRAYNRAAIANVNQKLHLSACTYFFYQERYHYNDKKVKDGTTTKSNEVPHSQDNSFLCIEGGEATKPSESSSVPIKQSPDNRSQELDRNRESDDVKSQRGAISVSQTNESFRVKSEKGSNITKSEDTKVVPKDDSKSTQKEADPSRNSNVTTSQDAINDPLSDTATNSCNASLNDAKQAHTKNNSDCVGSDRSDSQGQNLDSGSDGNLIESPTIQSDHTNEMTDENLKVLNKEIFLNQLQDIDDKWDKIKKDMWVRHKNEADSLHAVQTLEWEWKAKEIGACDVRVSLKIEPEFVPRVEVIALDY